MAIDTPAKIAILGAGPIGLEAALYARFLGYEVVILEQGEVGSHVLQWGHVRMFTPFHMNRSLLGIAAIRAQQEDYTPPEDDILLTGREWVERYLQPLAATDLLADHLRTGTQVLAISKEEVLKRELWGHEDRGDWPFRILVRNAAGEESIELADAVIDTTGVYGQANWLGHGGIPAVGELGLRSQIEYRVPEIHGRDRAKYAGQHTLLVGNGYSAATNAVALAALTKEVPETRVTWISRGEPVAGQGGPMSALGADPLEGRSFLVQQANELARAQHEDFLYWPRTTVEAVRRLEHTDGYEVKLVGEHGGMLRVDRIIANVGFRPDITLFDELQVDLSCTTQGPAKLAASIGKRATADFLEEKPSGPNSLITAEPNFYILGAKSYGRNPNFLVTLGLDQIRDLFRIIGERETLDLYAGAHKLLEP